MLKDRKIDWRSWVDRLVALVVAGIADLGLLLLPAVVEDLPDAESDESFPAESEDESEGQGALGDVVAVLLLLPAEARGGADVVDVAVTEEGNEVHDDEEENLEDDADSDELEQPLAIGSVVLVHADEDVAQGGECGEHEGSPLVSADVGDGAEDLEHTEDVGGRRQRAAAAGVVFSVNAHS